MAARVVELLAESFGWRTPGLPTDADMTSEYAQSALLDRECSRFTAALRRSLDKTGAVLIREFPVEDDVALVGLGASIGYVSTRGNGSPPRMIHEVVSSGRGESTHGLASRSSGEFLPHTDSCGYPRPHAYLILACIMPDPAGQGASTLVDSRDVIVDLPAAERTVLQRVKVPFWAAKGSPGRVLYASIVEVRPGRWRVRYRGDSLVRDEVSYQLAPEARAAVGYFEDAVKAAPALRLLLQSGDVLVIDNRRILHGRDQFAPESPRLLKRLKVHAAAENEIFMGEPSLW